MDIEFDFQSITDIEFGVCVDSSDSEEYYLIPVDNGVQTALKSMLEETVTTMANKLDVVTEIETYEPAQKYSTVEYLRLPLLNDKAQKISNLYDANNVQINTEILNELEDMVFYFAFFYDSRDRKCLAVRRASQFKGIVKARNRLIKIFDDTLKMLEDDIFKLDHDFDYIIDNQTIHILRPSGFEYTANMNDYILENAKSATEELGNSISFVDFESIANYVSSHKRAARIIASIRSRDDLDQISEQKLSRLCKHSGVEVNSVGGKLIPASGHELWFLNILDRRRYTTSLIDNVEETYEAANRRRVST